MSFLTYILIHFLFTLWPAHSQSSLCRRRFYRSARSFYENKAALSCQEMCAASYVTVISAINASASPSTVITRIRTTHSVFKTSHSTLLTVLRHCDYLDSLPPCVLFGAAVTGQTTEYRNKQTPLFLWIKLLEFHVSYTYGTVGISPSFLMVAFYFKMVALVVYCLNHTSRPYKRNVWSWSSL